MNQIGNDEEVISLAGYQVTRAEFFAHQREPSITIWNDRIKFNMACIRRFPGVTHIQLMIHPIEKRLVIRPCNPDFADAIRWVSGGGEKEIKNRDMIRVVLEELARIADETASIPKPEKGKWTTAGEIMGDGYSIAWRTLDAQYHGVPQRRRRIFLVADFAGGSAGKILFECEGLPGYPSQSGEAGQGAAADSEGSVGAAGCYSLQGSMIGRAEKNGPQGDGVNEDVSFTLNTIDRHAVCARSNG